jgi:signal transduction histidine kinase
MSAFDVGGVVTGVTELYEPVAEEKGFEMTVAVSPGLTMTGNRELIGQAIANLIDNALKYGAVDLGRGGRVDIVARREGSQILIEVADHGSGISNADRQRVFDRFVRLEGARSRPGSGLGLSLAAAVARLHGGTVRLDDNTPGLKVVVTLPARDPALAPPPAQAQAAE